VEISWVAAVDSLLTGVISTVLAFFSDNIVVVIGAFVSIAVFVWLLSILFRSAGVKKPDTLYSDWDKPPW
jgi:hypothetical protein